MKGLVFDIQGYSVHDGSGCRTLVFLSGCPLRCAWCSNPEGQILRPRVMHSAVKCRRACDRCFKACPNSAVQILQGADPPIKFNRSICDQCDDMKCVKACLNQALRIVGRSCTIDDLMRDLVRDQQFWGSRGGVTFGGGEPLFQAEFLLALLEKCRANYMHTTIETSAHADTHTFMEVLKRTDAVFIDIKHMDPSAHLSGTGVGNELILRNIEAAASSGWDGQLIIRVPVVPGFNDTPENLEATAEFMTKIQLKEVNLLPFHRLGHSKYEQLGLDDPYAQVPAPSMQAMRSFQHIFRAAGLQCSIGSETAF
jgi:pyruvate formate lyase activating enzyme